MKVRVLTSHILRGGTIAEVGDVLDLPDNVARVKVTMGYAEAVPVAASAPEPVKEPEASTEGQDSGEGDEVKDKGDGGDATQPKGGAPAQKPGHKSGGKDK
jgi:hypothetical protein